MHPGTDFLLTFLLSGNVLSDVTTDAKAVAVSACTFTEIKEVLEEMKA